MDTAKLLQIYGTHTAQTLEPKWVIHSSSMYTGSLLTMAVEI